MSHVVFDWGGDEPEIGIHLGHVLRHHDGFDHFRVTAPITK